jgi:uncharacterized protein (TIGR00369 family)
MTVVDPTGAPEAWGPSRSKTVTWWDPAATSAAGAGRTGLEIMQALAAGEVPPPPIAMLMGMYPIEVERGRVLFEVRPDESAYNPIGLVHGGLVCTLADSVAGCAVHTTLDAGVGYTSIDITVNYLRPVTLDSGLLRATGVVTKPGRRVALASVEIHDGAGKLVATGSSNCLIISQAP